MPGNSTVAAPKLVTVLQIPCPHWYVACSTPALRRRACFYFRKSQPLQQ